MVREFRWRFTVRSYESDASSLVPASVILRYLEQSAVIAAADAGFDREFHEEHGTAWVIRRMNLVVRGTARSQDELEVTTWASDFERVRAGREYRVFNLTAGVLLAEGIAQWVY